MRTRNKLINIRVTNDEWTVLERKAKKCGLSLSAYLRKVGLNQNIKTAPSSYLYEAYQAVCNMNNSQLNGVADLILKAYHDGETTNGSNENLGN